MFDQAETLVPPIDRRLREAMTEVLGAAWLADWEKGIPEWEQVPGHINIWEILRLWNYAKSLDMVEFGKMRYNLLGNADHWFPGPKVRRFDDRRMIELHRDSPIADRLPAILREAHALLDAR